ncbi:MAG TPA: hypothetical protein PKO06_02105, partial [Candidatus Ozemobacteraceae bacterium]|nr:hypothetical protein [Candidatus Ozemobacteraceae bacterium]
PNSPIKIQKTASGIELHWDPFMGCGPARFIPAAFLMFWLCGWLVGELFAISAFIMCILKMQIIPAIFLAIWLTGWSVGGYFAIRVLRGMLQPSRPERLVFEEHLLQHDAGLNPMTWMSQTSKLAKRRTTTGEMVEIRRTDVQNIRMEKGSKGRLRLIVDCEAGSVEMGMMLSHADKQWVFQRLRDWWGRET